MKRISSLKILCPSLFFLLASIGCSNGNDLTVINMPAQGQVISNSETIQLQFASSITANSIEVTGDMASEANSVTMATTLIANDTLSLTPTTSWSGGDSRSMIILAKDTAGNASQIKLTLNIPINFSSYQNASVVIGQQDFVSDDYLSVDLSGTPNDRSVETAYGNPLIFNNYLYLPDYAGNRVLVFDEIPTSNLPQASAVLGQSDFDQDDSDSSATDLSGPQQVASSGKQFFIVEYSNYRVSVYNQQPTATATSADLVLGQTSFGPTSDDCTVSGFYDPESVFATENYLFVADSDNNRVLIWNLPITHNGQAADLVLGQSDFVNCDSNAGESNTNSKGLVYPTAVWSDENKVIVLDYSNNRALIWNSFPTENGVAANVVIGQADFISNDDNGGLLNSEIDGRGLYEPYNGLDSNGMQLCITDTENHRVLIWNTIPTTNYTAADVVFGQADFTKGAGNDSDGDGSGDSAPSARTLKNPKGCYFYNNKMFVNDMNNDRWLIYNEQ